MKVKIDTSEKFHVITIQESVLSANMTEALQDILEDYLQKEVKNVVLNMEDVGTIDREVVVSLIKIQHFFYENKVSFVICQLQKQVLKMLEDAGLPNELNVTPTLSEAWDIVQMEEIERELGL